VPHPAAGGHAYRRSTRRLPTANGRRKSPASDAGLTGLIADPVPWHNPGAHEIGFDIPVRYNASEILFQNLANGGGARRAIIGPGGERSYAQLCADAARWGNALSSLGLKRGERVVLLLDDTPIYPAAFFGAVRAGFVPVLVNVLAPPDLLRFYLADSAARVAVVDAAFCERLDDSVRLGTQLKMLIVTNGEPLPDIEADVKAAAPWLAGFPGRLHAADTHRNEMAYWVYSSGSTGRPKGIVHLHHDMPYTARSYGDHVLKLAADDVCFSPSKIFFSYGFSNSITFPFAAGATSLLMPGPAKPAAVFAAIARYRPTVFFGLPTLYAALLSAPQSAAMDLSSVRLAISAAEVLSRDLFDAWTALTGREIVECLGSTEVQNVYLSNRPRRKKSGAVGMRVPGYELLLRDDDGNDVDGAGEGTLWIRGQSNTPLYWNRPEQTAKVIDEEGWLRTADRFARDTDGFYFFRGRDDDLVKVSGQWVHPMEVQRCLAEYPGVRECAVVAVTRVDRRITLKAFVVMARDSFDAGAMTRSLQEFVKQRLLPYKYPRIVQFMRELPKTGTGKVDRQALVATEETQAAGGITP